MALIERFYDALEGSIEYMGQDIKSLNLKWYRDQIGKDIVSRFDGYADVLQSKL